MASEDEIWKATWRAFEQRLGKIEDLLVKMIDRVSSIQSCVDSVKRTVTALQLRVENFERSCIRDCEEKRSKLITILEDKIKERLIIVEKEIEQVEEAIYNVHAETRDVEKGVSNKVEKEIGKTVTTRITDISEQVRNLAESYGNLVNDFVVVKNDVVNLKLKPKDKEDKSFSRMMSVITLLVAFGSAIASIILGILTFARNSGG